MGERTTDGSAGDADHGVIGASCSGYRQPDPRLAAAITRALGADLDSGAWDERHGQLRTRAEDEGSLVLVVAEP